MILSSEVFNRNEALWAKDRSLNPNEFLAAKRNAEAAFFEGKPLASIEDKSVTDVEQQAEEAALIEISAVEEETLPEEPAEETVTLTESEYNEKLAQARAETESRLKEVLEEKFKLELNQLQDQQTDFFRSILNNLTDGDSLVTDIVSLSLRIGELLARSQLQLDEKVVLQFIEDSIMKSEFNESDFVSIRVSNQWQAYRDSLDGPLPDGLSLLFDETLKPGDIIVSAGQGGYFDLLKDRINIIEDQLNAIEYPGSSELLTDSMRQFFFENSSSELEKAEQADETSGGSSDEKVATSPQDEINLEQTAFTGPENQAEENFLEPRVDGELANSDDEVNE